jgi:dTMP kinase
MSKIVVIEGADRCGKATQSALLKNYVENKGLRATIVEVPIRSMFTYRIVYWMLQNGLAKKFPKLFQGFQFINRKVFQVLSLPRLEKLNDVIIMDRWSLSTIVYGASEGVSQDFTMKLAKKLRKPDHTIILLGPAFPHEAEDAYEADKLLQDRVRIGYSQWAANNPATTTLINCRQDKAVISEKIQSALIEKGILLQSNIL